MTATHTSLPIDSIRESKTNPRKTFDPAKLAELADSIRNQGVLQPVVCRPNGKGSELVIGARRLRAAKAAGLTEIPAVLREMTDQEVLEAQLVENAQRTDVGPLEEADAYRQLHEKHGLDVEEIAAKVGKSRGTVYGRMKLCALQGEGRKLVEAGTLSASIGLLLARIPDPTLQDKAAKAMGQEDRWTGEPMSYREAADHIQRQYMLRLKDAPFETNDADLVPAAGSCQACPKRTGNQRELFEDVKGADVCTDPPCFQRKVDAWWALESAAAAEKGLAVLSAKETRKAFPHGHLTHGSGFVELSSCNYRDPKSRTWARLLPKKIRPEVTLARTEDGVVHELVNERAALKAIRDAGHAWAKPRSAERSTGSGSREDYQRRAAARREVEDAVATRVTEAIVEKAEAHKGDFLKPLVEMLVQGTFGHDEILERRGWVPTKPATKRPRYRSRNDGEKLLLERVGQASEAELRGLAVEIAIGIEGVHLGDVLKAQCKRLGVDLAAINKAVRAEHAAKAKAEKAAAAKAKREAAKKKPARKKTPARKKKAPAKKAARRKPSR